MTEFKLKILTPEGVVYDGMAESVIVRTTVGDKGILAKHEPYVAALTIGQALSLIHISNGLASIGVPAVCSLYFDLFSAFIQAYIFCTLTMAYVSMAECGDD